MIGEKRVRWYVVPVPRSLNWEIRKGHAVVGTRVFKYRAVEFAVAECRFELQAHGTLSELLISGRDGRYTDARTFGKDPRESVG